MSQDSFKLTISRSAINNDGALTYRIIATCQVTKNTSSNSIRLDQNVFVKNLETGSFARVANASDLGVLKSSKVEAESIGHSEYRDSVASFDFSDVDTAVAAIPVLRDRVNTCVHNYIKYVTEFESVSKYPAVYNLPLPSVDQEDRDSRILAYTDSRDARIEIENELSQDQNTLDALAYKQEYMSDLKKIVCDLESSLSAKESEVRASYQEVMNIEGSNWLEYWLGTATLESTSGGNFYTYTEDAYNQMISKSAVQSQLLRTSVSDCLQALTAAVASLSIKCQSIGATSNSLKTQTDSINTSMSNRAKELDSAAIAESSALADLAEYCPDVDPDSL